MYIVLRADDTIKVVPPPPPPRPPNLFPFPSTEERGKGVFGGEGGGDGGEGEDLGVPPPRTPIHFIALAMEWIGDSAGSGGGGT